MDISRHLDLLTQAGFKVVPVTSRDIIIDDGDATEARIVDRQRIPRPENIHRDLQYEADADVLLYLLPRTNNTIRMITQSNPRLAAVGLDDKTIVFKGNVITLGEDLELERPVRRRPWGRFATVREIIRHHGHRKSQTTIALETGISQAAVSQALRQLRDRQLLPVDPGQLEGPHSLRALIDYAITEYPGPGGITTYWYDFDHAAETAHKLRDVIGINNALIGGDLAADEYAPWKSVTRLALYFPTGIDMTRYGVAEASPEEANIVLRIPSDASIFHTARAWAKDRARPDQFTDPVITAWELTQSPDSDADQAVAQLKRFLESRRWP